MANDKAKPTRYKNYSIIIPVSRTEMRIVEKKSQAEVESYVRRNNYHNFVVIAGKNITRNFRR